METHSAWYQKLMAHKLSEAELQYYRFPRLDACYPGATQGQETAQLYNVQNNNLTHPPTGHVRHCDRCNTDYHVQNDGNPVTNETCRYHPDTSQPIYRCCQKPVGADPCTIASYHVTSTLNTNDLKNFVDTGKNQATGKHDIVGLACQLVYTLAGMEVAAVALVDSSCRPLYETLVLPSTRVLDYDTCNTGLEPCHFRNVNTRLYDVQKKLSSLLASDTLLVGHRLSQTLLRLRVIHHHILDTAHQYLHPDGPPATYTLQDLANRHLQGRFIDQQHFRCMREAISVMMLAQKHD